MPGPDFNLNGKVALITGSGRGIGLGMAQALAAHGCAIALQDIDQDLAEAEAQKLRGAGGQAIALGGDMCDLTLPPKLVEQTRGQLGGIHILINNAAIQSEQNWLEVRPEQAQREWAANLLAPIGLCQQVAPIFRKQRWGRIVNIGSIQQKLGNPGMLTYAMSKAALENMTKALAQDLAKDGVTVNLIAPGYFNTWRNREHLRTPEDRAREAARWVPMGRIGEPEEVAGTALLLCSEAGGYITGQSIYVDGGMGLR